MENKIISIFMLIYKNQHKIEDALRSVFFQEIPLGYAVELVISDDASPDFDSDALMRLLADISKANLHLDWRVVSQPVNLGTVKHLNGVLSLLSGDVIVPLGVDDAFYEADTLCKIVRFFEQNDFQLATGIRQIYSSDFSKVICSEPSASRRRILRDGRPEKVLNCLVKDGNFISGASTYYRRSLFDKIGFFDEQYKLLEDYPFYLNVAEMGVQIGYMDFPVIKYRLGGITSSGVLNPLLKQDFVNLHLRMLSNYGGVKKYSNGIRFRLFKMNALSLGVFDFFKMSDVFFRYYAQGVVKKMGIYFLL